MPVRELPSTTPEGDVPLAGGGTADPDEFFEMENLLYDHEEGEEGWRNRLSIREGDPITPFRTGGSWSVRTIAGTRHQERSRHARTADESFNAPIAPDYATWRANPNRYDLPGVDTIPDERQRARARSALEHAQQRGIVEDYREDEPLSRNLGEFKRAGRKVKMQSLDELDEAAKPGERAGAVLAHEVGHAIDHHVYVENIIHGEPTEEQERKIEEGPKMKGIPDTWFMSELDLEKGSPLHEQAVHLSQRKRGTIERSEGSYREYRERQRELMADALALSIIEPRAARREAPDLMARLEDAYLAELEEAG